MLGVAVLVITRLRLFLPLRSGPVLLEAGFAGWAYPPNDQIAPTVGTAVAGAEVGAAHGFRASGAERAFWRSSCHEGHPQTETELLLMSIRAAVPRRTRTLRAFRSGFDTGGYHHFVATSRPSSPPPARHPRQKLRVQEMLCRTHRRLTASYQPRSDPQPSPANGLLMFPPGSFAEIAASQHTLNVARRKNSVLDLCIQIFLAKRRA